MPLWPPAEMKRSKLCAGWFPARSRWPGAPSRQLIMTVCIDHTRNWLLVAASAIPLIKLWNWKRDLQVQYLFSSPGWRGEAGGGGGGQVGRGETRVMRGGGGGSLSLLYITLPGKPSAFFLCSESDVGFSWMLTQHHVRHTVCVCVRVCMSKCVIMCK